MELGLAEGLKKKAAKPYYILLNTRRSREVPSDIRGLQRLEYTSYDFKPEVGLGHLLVEYILSKEYWVKKVSRALAGEEKSEKKKLLALRVLAHFRDHDKLTPDNLTSLSRGTHLRKNDLDDVVTKLLSLKIIKKLKKTSVYVSRRQLFKLV